MIKFLASLIAFALFTHLAIAQANSSFLHSIRSSEPYLSLSADNSKFTNRGVQFLGLGAGLQIEEKYALGFSYNWLNNRVITSEFNTGGKLDRIQFRYAQLLGSFQYYNHLKLSSSIELAIGAGNITRWLLPQELYGPTSRVALLEPAIRARYNILNWLSFSFMLGLRVCAVQKPFRASDINSAKIDVGLSVSPMALVQALKTT
ncbi:MAG: hypothetical protein KDC92_15300 [Bacteroidetes bacterium]|nr:hypothetical protein [Bacteroidota bacterium]